MKSRTTYSAIGIMSGTSLDGLDLAHCVFTKKRKWQFEIQSAATIKYSKDWKNRLSGAHFLSGQDLLILDVEYGAFIGKCCRDFIVKNRIRNIDLVASHGHTVFHQPKQQFTFQLGDGNAIHGAVRVPVVFDFRSLDVALGGEGAPLVPIGDRYLFSQYDVCLNLGGIANLSMEKNRRRIAFDICYANLGLNYLAQKNDQEFDVDGKLASRGEVNASLLKKITSAYKFQRASRPSLGREGFELNMVPLLNNELLLLEDRMLTFCQSVANEVKRSIPPQKKKLKLLVTGGGAFNPVLIQLLQQNLEDIAQVMGTPKKTIEFKEALIFAFLGVLRMRGETNVLKSVTRASRDSCSGSVVGM